MANIEVLLFYHLKEKAGTGSLKLEMPGTATIKDLKKELEIRFPGLKSHLENILVLKEGKVVLDEEEITEDSKIAFLTPIGGG
jgi:molybdopterin converting factor small subunit